MEPTVVTEGEHSTHSSISLAGLLNMIDGAASREIRVCACQCYCSHSDMLPGPCINHETKNPEKLDSALTRPGRINFWIKFTLATHGQIRQIFYRMYDSDLDKKKSPRKTPIAPIKIQNNASNEKENAWIRQYLRTPTPFVAVNSTELAQVSRRFRRSSSRGSLLSSRQLFAPLFRP
jgi:chaperone BCS1